MPTTDPGRSVTRADVILPAVPSVPPASGRGHAWAQDDAATEDPVVRDPRLLRPATYREFASRRYLRPRPFDDTSNYLG